MGFAASCNRGSQAACGQYLLFLNNDTEVCPNWWLPLAAVLDSVPGVGIVAPKLIFPDATIQHCGIVWKDLAASNAQPHHIYYRFPSDTPCVQKSRNYAAVTGACILLRKNEFLTIGPFDEEYQNGWEDTDLCYTYHSKGMLIRYCADSCVVHHQSLTLNEEISVLCAALPGDEELSLINSQLECHKDESTIEKARDTAKKMELLDKRLVAVRQRFNRNRAHFFAKWGKVVKRDDYRYYLEDCFDRDPDMARLTPNLRAGLGTPMEDFLVSIVILTWNQLDCTKECLASIYRHTDVPHEIIVVDNGSHDGSVEWLRDQVLLNPSMRLVANDDNRGFAAACNQGIRLARGAYILLLNNDVVVTPEWLSGMMECFVNNTETGIVGPMTNNISGPQMIEAACYQSLEELDSFAASIRARFRYRRIPLRRIVGFCMLFKRELIEQIGTLDERFGSGNFEDDDFCLRAALEGYRNLVAGDVFIHHVGSASFRANRLDYRQVMSGNRKEFNEKWSVPVTDFSYAQKILTLQTMEKADMFRQRWKLDDAVEALLQEGIRHVPHDARLYYAIADYLIDATQYTDALDTLASSPQEAGNPERLWREGVCREALGEYDAAQVCADQALASNPGSAQALNLKGDIAYKMGKSLEAKSFYNKACCSDPAFGLSYTNLAHLLSEQGARDEALELFERGFILSPLSARTVSLYHETLCANEVPERGIPLFRDAIRFYPANKTLSYLLIDLLIRTDDASSALKEVERAISCFGVDKGILEAALPMRDQLGFMAIEPSKLSVGQSVSLCMIVKNEEKALPRCLASLKPIVDEMVIVDTGSTDTTREIARLYGARLVEYPWAGDFSAARNAGIEQAKGDWILSMDADEVISPLDHEAFKKLLETSNVAWEITTRNYMVKVNIEKWQPNDGHYTLEEAAAGWTPSNKVRLFPNRRDIRFQNPIHEMVEPSLSLQEIPVCITTIPVHHYGYLDQDKMIEKKREYYRLGKDKLEKFGGNDPKALYELAVQAAEVEEFEEAVALWERLLHQQPDISVAYFNMGYCQLKLGRFSESLNASRKAMDLQAPYPEAAANCAIAELCVGSAEAAEYLVRSTIALVGETPNLLLVLGVVLICLGESSAGESYLQRLATQQVSYDLFIKECIDKLLTAGREKYAQHLLDSVAATS